MEAGAVRVMIVDDHAVVRSGLSTFLMAYDDLEFVGDASGGLEAVRKCPDLPLRRGPDGPGDVGGAMVPRPPG